jgi:hypothetical protein
MHLKPVSYLPLQVTCLGHYCIAYRPGGVGGQYAVVQCDRDVTRDLVTFPTEAARAWIAAHPASAAGATPDNTCREQQQPGPIRPDRQSEPCFSHPVLSVRSMAPFRHYPRPILPTAYHRWAIRST